MAKDGYDLVQPTPGSAEPGVDPLALACTWRLMVTPQWRLCMLLVPILLVRNRIIEVVQTVLIRASIITCYMLTECWDGGKRRRERGEVASTQELRDVLRETSELYISYEKLTTISSGGSRI